MTEGKPVLTKVVINGTTIKDDSSTENYLISWSRNETLTGDIVKEITIVCPRNIENILDLTDENLIGKDKFVVVTRGVSTSTEETVFQGVIKNYNIVGGLVTFTCADKLYNTTKDKINYTYDKDIDASAGKISEILIDAITTYTDLTADATSVQDSGDILTRDKVVCKSAPVFDIITNELAKPLHWNVFYNPVTDKVNFEPEGYTNNSTVLESGVNILNSPNWKSDELNIFNKIEVQGAEQEIQTIEDGQIGVDSGYTTSSIQLIQIPKIVRVLCDAADPPTTEKVGGVVDSTSDYDYSVDATKKQIIWSDDFTPGGSDYVIVEYSFNRPTPIIVSDPDSITEYGLKELTVIKENLKSVSDARLYANALLSEYKYPVLSTTLQVTNVQDIRPGQQIRVTDNQNNIDDYFYVTDIRQKYPYNYDEIKVTSEILDVDDGFFVFVINKLKSLDRQTKDDFDTLIEVKSFSNDAIYENRYIKITNKTITGSDGFILGNPAYGILGTSTLGDPTYDESIIFMQNSERRYVELFYDEEFKDASTTADWDTANQWVEVTG